MASVDGVLLSPEAESASVEVVLYLAVAEIDSAQQVGLLLPEGLVAVLVWRVAETGKAFLMDQALRSGNDWVFFWVCGVVDLVGALLFVVWILL